MKILDRYLISSIVAAFFFGVAMFLGLLMAMDLLQRLVRLIAEQGVPVSIALIIFGYSIPQMLMYAFPMAMLLSILLVYNRMSADSEMVAIRAAGVSFARTLLPTLGVALAMTGLTFGVANYFAPFASAAAARLEQKALAHARGTQPVKIIHERDGHWQYALLADGFDLGQARLDRPNVVFYDKSGIPSAFIHADTATWDTQAGRWQFTHASIRFLMPQSPRVWILPTEDNSALIIDSYLMQLEETPFDIASADKDPEELSAQELRQYIAHLRQMGTTGPALHEWEMGLAHRYAVPFSCLIFALIGAPLGLRHHRTSSAMGLGISLIVILIYYPLYHYLDMFGESGRMAPMLAAWLPNLLGAILGCGLIVRANR